MSRVQPYTVDIVETYLDGYRWYWSGTFSGSTIDVAVRRASQYNARQSRAPLLGEHGPLLSMVIGARREYRTTT